MTERRRVALLQVDIAGFSIATDRLSGRRSEELQKLVGDCFGLLTEVLAAHGGEILAFAGDAILAIWDESDAVEAVGRAAQCGLALRDVMLAWGREHGDIGQRTAIEIGDVHFCRMGGHAGQWHTFTVGEPIVRMGAAYRAASIGDVSLCADAAAVLADLSDGEPTSYGRRLIRVRSQPAPRRRATSREKASSDEAAPRCIGREGAEFERATWAGEFRALTIVRIVRSRMSFEGDFQRQLQSLVYETQAAADAFEGVLNQVLMDDKGLNLNVIFGLPRRAHEDDPLRAVESALTIHQRMQALGIDVSVGVATGGLFCGEYGGPLRREYGVFGQAINLAVLLADSALGDVLCDAATAQAVGSCISFSLLPPVYSKGGTATTLAYAPRGRAERVEDRHAIVGRETERARLRDFLDEIGRGRGNLVLVSGEPGIGKSRVLQDLIGVAQMRGLTVLQGGATSINRRSAYFVWRNVLQQVLGHPGGAHPALLHARLEECFAGQPSHLGWLPLLETVLPAGFVETSLTDQITGAARAAAVEELVVSLLVRFAAPAVMVLEDLHWFDTASADLLVTVARRVPGLLVVVSNRTGPVAGSAVDRQAQLAPGAEIRLQPLPRDAIDAILRRRLQVLDIPPELADFVHRHAGGNPFYADELALALRDTGRVSVARGICKLHDLGAPSDGVALTDSLERAIVSRIDVLDEEDQMFLKVASAIGDEFTLSIVAGILPGRSTRAPIEASARRLVDSDFLVMNPSAEDARFDFRHSLTREATYSLLSQAQRHTLHRAIATFIEQANAAHLQPFHARLARHWELADDAERALHYLELAAGQALLNYSNDEAISYVRKMLAITRQAKVALSEDREAMWQIISGDAYHELSEYDSSSQCYARAMALLNQPLPATRSATLRALLRNVALHLLYRLSKQPAHPGDAGRRVALQRASHIYECLSEQYFFLNDSLAVLNGTLASLNLAQRSAAIPEIIRGFGALSLGLGMSGLVKPARDYSRRAHALAQERGSLPDIARVQLVSGVLEYGLGEWDIVHQRSEQAVRIFRRLGDRARAQTSEVMAAFAALLSGNVVRALALNAALGAELSERSSAQVRVWHLSISLLLDLLTGSAPSVDTAELRRLADARLVRTDRLLCLGVLAKAHERQGDNGLAGDCAVQALEVMAECSAVWGGYAYGPAAAADVLMSRWERSSPGDRMAVPARAPAEACVQQLARIARHSPVCRPFACIARGRARVITHRIAAARHSFRQAAALAERLRMPCEEAHAHRRLGATFAPGQAHREHHLGHAAALYDRLGAAGDLQQVQQALASEPGGVVG